MHVDQTAHAKNLLVPLISPQNNEGHLPLIVDETDARKPFMRDALCQPHCMEISEVDAALREGFVEL